MCYLLSNGKRQDNDLRLNVMEMPDTQKDIEDVSKKVSKKRGLKKRTGFKTFLTIYVLTTCKNTNIVVSCILAESFIAIIYNSSHFPLHLIL